MLPLRRKVLRQLLIENRGVEARLVAIHQAVHRHRVAHALEHDLNIMPELLRGLFEAALRIRLELDAQIGCRLAVEDEAVGVEKSSAFMPSPQQFRAARQKA